MIRLTDLEALAMAGGDPTRVVDALILAHERDFPLSFMDRVKSSLSGESCLSLSNRKICKRQRLLLID